MKITGKDQLYCPKKLCSNNLINSLSENLDLDFYRINHINGLTILELKELTHKILWRLKSINGVTKSFHSYEE